MRSKLFLWLVAAGFLVSGCVHHPPSTPASVNTPAPIITPDTSLTAKVVRYNSVGRFVVLSFPVGQMPQVGQLFFLYRAGLKVGEVKVTGPQRDNDIVADLTAGDAQMGDDVREQ